MKKQTINIFIIHLWSMAEVRERIWHRLKEDVNYAFVDLSYPLSKPIEKVDFIQDYACGAMMEADIVLVLPETDEIVDPHYENISLSHFNIAGFRRFLQFDPYKVYPVELQTLMYDWCNTKPVLVLGWTKQRAENLAKLLKDPEGVVNYNPNRFFSMGLNDVWEGESIVERIVSILDNFQI